MNFDGVFSSTNVSSTGLTAERFRMEVVANNIANALSTRSANGGPYRRQEVVFAAMLNDSLEGRRMGVPTAAGDRHAVREGLAGVEVVSQQDDPSPFRRVHNPGHPDADAQGFVDMPNVDLPIEMVNLITASRGYEANLRAIQVFRQMADQAIGLMRR